METVIVGARAVGSRRPWFRGGVFTTQLEQELLAGRVDIAVHSLKDFPPDGLVLAMTPVPRGRLGRAGPSLPAPR